MIFIAFFFDLIHFHLELNGDELNENTEDLKMVVK